MLQVKSILLVTLLSVVGCSEYWIPAKAENLLVQPLKSRPPKPPDRGTPTNNDGAPATRGNCPETAFPLRPVLAKTEAQFSGFTLSEYPTLWFYIPYQSRDISQGILKLEDREGNLHTWVSFVLPQTPGFVSISLQQTGKPLEKNQRYYWILMLDCASTDFAEPDRDWRQGWIERVDRPDLEMQLQTATVEQRLNLYLEHQIGYDAPMDLVEIHPFPSVWRKLLQAVGMENYASETIAGSVELVENE